LVLKKLDTILHFDTQDIAKVAEVFAEENWDNHMQRLVSFDVKQMFTELDQAWTAMDMYEWYL
jgi:hypothetical protein